MEKCTNCNDMGWVCENHTDKPWSGCTPPDMVSCGCGAGQPCHVCNPSDYDNPPKDPPGWRTGLDKDGYRH